MRTLLAALCLSLPAQAQVVIAPRFEPERVDRFRLEATLTLEQQGEEAVPARTLTQRLDLELTTAQIDPDGRAIVSLAINAADVRFQEGDEELTFTWPPDAGQGDAAPDDLAAVWTPLVDEVFRIQVDPDGRLRMLQGTEQMADRLEDLDVEGGRAMLGLFAPEVLERTLRPIWGIDVEKTPRSPGDTWRIGERISISGERRLQIVRTHTLDAVDDHAAAITFVAEMENLPPDAPTLVNVTATGQGEGSARWNLDRAITDSWQEEAAITIEASLQEEDPITTRLTRQVTLTRLQDDS